MIKRIFYIILLLQLSCDKIPGVSNMALTPENSSFSEKNNLLVERYTYPKDTIIIFGNKYIITDAWVTHNFKNRTSDEVNFNYLAFFCTFKNIKTNEYFIDVTLGDYDKVLSHNVNSYGHGFQGLGNKFAHYSLFFKDTNVNNLQDTIKIFVKENKQVKTLYFYKYSSFYKK